MFDWVLNNSYFSLLNEVTMIIDSSIFKAYDIRGTYPEQINAEIAYKIGYNVDIDIGYNLDYNVDIDMGSGHLFRCMQVNRR